MKTLLEHFQHLANEHEIQLSDINNQWCQTNLLVKKIDLYHDTCPFFPQPPLFPEQTNQTRLCHAQKYLLNLLNTQNKTLSLAYMQPVFMDIWPSPANICGTSMDDRLSNLVDMYKNIIASVSIFLLIYLFLTNYISDPSLLQHTWQ